MSAIRIGPPSEAALIERITLLEERKAAVAAEQVDAMGIVIGDSRRRRSTGQWPR